MLYLSIDLNKITSLFANIDGDIMQSTRMHTVWSMVLLAYTLSFLGTFTSNAVIAIIPTLEHAFSVSIALISLSITLYLIPFSFTQLFSGAISDRIGLFKGILFGLSVFTFASVYVALSPDVYHFITARAIQGVGSAFLYPSAMALLGEFSSQRHKGKIMSGFGVAATAGVSLGPLVGGYIAQFDWRYLFYILSMIAILLSVLFFSRRNYLTALELAEEKNIITNIIIAFKDTRLLMIGILGFLIFFVRLAFYTYLSETLSKAPYFFDPLMIGLYISVAGFAGLISSPIAGYLIDNAGKRKTIILGSVALIMTFILYFMESLLTYLLLMVMLMSFSITLIFISFSIIAIEINPKLRPTYSSVYNSIRFFGYSLGPTLSLPVFLVFSFDGIIVLCLSTAIFIFMLSMTNFMKQFG